MPPRRAQRPTDSHPIAIVLLAQFRNEDSLLVQLARNDVTFLLGALLLWCDLKHVYLKSFSHTDFGTTVMLDTVNTTKEAIAEECERLLHSRSVRQDWRILRN